MNSDGDVEQRCRKLVSDFPPGDVDQFTFRGAQYDAGLAWVHFPVGKGGMGLTRDKQTIVELVFRELGVPYHDLLINPIGIGMCAPTLLTYGSDALHADHLRAIFTGEQIWCQLFSEPSHGSDVAGIPSRATRDGDCWTVSGQKVWTTLAHIADYGLLLTRTDPDVPKHRGLSCFVLDMHAPGVDVRPLFQMTGDADFNEVFLTDVALPSETLLGQVGDGWRIATTTLLNERVALGGSGAKGVGSVRTLMNLWERRRDAIPAAQRAVMRDRVTALWIRSEALRLTNDRAKRAVRNGSAGPEGSIGKLFWAELNQDIFETCTDLEGADGMLHEAGYPMVRADTMTSGRGSLSSQFLRSRANTIEGGTSEIMRNILGERVLGLPGEPRVDRDLPWSEIPR